MAQITILEDIVFPDGSANVVSATITKDGCIIKYASTEVIVSWEQMNDVEQLSEMFADSSVRVFKSVVKLLGKLHSNATAYKDIV